MRIPWPKKTQEHEQNAPAEARIAAPAEAPIAEKDPVTLMNERRSSWGLNRDDGHVTLFGELYNPTDQWIAYVEARVTFERKAGNGKWYVTAARLLELHMEIPPRESRPFRCTPDPCIECDQIKESPVWDYEVTRVELVDRSAPLLIPQLGDAP